MTTPTVARVLMRVCSARLDPNVSADEFVELLEELIDQTHEAALQESLGTDDPSLPEKGPSSRIPLSPPSSAPQRDPPKYDDPDGKLSYDDKTRIRQRHREACEGRQRAPNGWLEATAAEFRVSRKVIKDVIYRKDGT